ncbi:ribosomal protein L7/L12 [Streptomyces sp. Marseille-Q5077]|uniref:ribosomal protein L7/L12 n=1 Tax=Streptomyces sp. Marseille-Q5077 TaxID=3418995 RepID=UPI003D07D008
MPRSTWLGAISFRPGHLSELMTLKTESGSRQHDLTRRSGGCPPDGLPASDGGIVEEPEFGVLLSSSGDPGIDLVQAVRSVTGLSAWRSKRLLQAAPTTVVDRTWFEAATEAVRSLNAAGARADLDCRWCGRVFSCEDVPVDADPCSSPFLSPDGCPASRPRA